MSRLSTAGSTWQLDPAHTHVEFAVRHLMISTVKGGFADVQGAGRMDEANPGAGKVEVTIGVASIDTRQDERDATPSWAIGQQVRSDSRYGRSGTI